MDFIREQFGLTSPFEAPGSLLSAVQYLRANHLACVVRAKPLLRLRLRFSFWMAGLDVPVLGYAAASESSGGALEAKLHLVYCHDLYQLPRAEGWWHYVVEMRRGSEVSLFDSFLLRARETFGDASVTGYPPARELDALSEVCVAIAREPRL